MQITKPLVRFGIFLFCRLPLLRIIGHQTTQQTPESLETSRSDHAQPASPIWSDIRPSNSLGFCSGGGAGIGNVEAR